MKKKKSKLIILCFVLLSAALFLLLPPSIVSKNSIVRIVEEDKVTFETTSSSFITFKGSEKLKVYNVGLNFQVQDYFYAKNRNEKFLKNYFSFSVMFPDEHICESDTALLFNQIRAHAYICKQKASNLINEDYYYNGLPYPEIFEKLLNQDRGELLKNLYFTDVKISKIIFEQKYDLDDMTALMFSNNAFLMESLLYQELVLDEHELRSLNNSLVQSYTNQIKSLTKKN